MLSTVLRDEAYSILNDLIFKGFIVSEVNLGRRFVFKTVNDAEFDLIRMLTGGLESGNLQNFNACFLALSLFAVDTEMILPDRKRRVAEIRDLFLSMPQTFLSRMIVNMNDLRNIVFQATDYLEGFCYTSGSRKSWRTLGGVNACEDYATGIPGTSDLGLNVHQEMWAYINRILDDDDDYDRQFNMALMVASASNPKGASHMRNQHTTAMRSVEDRRIQLAKIGKHDSREWRPEGWSAPVDTAELLVAELERQMQGKKDRHDQFMDAYMQKLHDQAEKKAKEAEERIKRAREGLEDVFITGETRELTPEETEEFMRKRYRKTTINVGTEEKAGPAEKDRFMRKIGHRVLTAR